MVPPSAVPPPPPPPPRPPLRWKYDVFLSFRGMDTRDGFTSHLYHALSKNGIYTFMDVQLTKGEDIAKELNEKIEQSRGSIVIFSENYASSRWCLDELVTIIDCKKRSEDQNNVWVWPIFYKVDPTEARHQTGTTKGHMARHEERFGRMSNKVSLWRRALNDLAGMAGYPFRSGMIEAQVIQEIVKEVSSKFDGRIRLNIAHYPIGVDDHEQSLNPILKVGLDDHVRMIGIHGGKGLGKSTIAKRLYNKYADEFQGSSFLANVKVFSRKHKLEKVQETLLHEVLGDYSQRVRNVDKGVMVIRQRLCSRKVLVVVDDVDDIDQLRQLAGDREWFGSGSRIIITAQDKHLLQSHGVQHLYEVKKLNDDHSCHLFCWYAFKKPNPPKEFKQLVNRILQLVSGIPLAITVMGSHLYGRGIEEWIKAIVKLEKLKHQLHEVADAAFRISYKGLDPSEKTTFVLISCFLNGKERDDIVEILNGSEPLLGSCIEVLVSKCLVSVDRTTLWVHDLARELAMRILRAISSIKSGMQHLIKGVDEATDELADELADDIKSIAKSIFHEILEDDDEEDSDSGNKEEDVIDELVEGIEEVVANIGSAVDELTDDIKSIASSAFQEVFEDSDHEEEEDVSTVEEFLEATKADAESIFEEVFSLFS